MVDTRHEPAEAGPLSWLGLKSRAAIVTAASCYMLARYAPNAMILGSTFLTTVIALAVELVAYLTYTIIIYPNFLSPLRHLPTPPGASLWNGHFKKIRAEPTGDPMREWINTVPNDGVIWYKAQFNTERVLITNPKALADVLVNNSYDFIKPKQLAQTIGRILGIGILFAEGDEHKRQRKGLNPAFQFRHIKELYPLIWAKCEEMVQEMYKSINTPTEPTPENPNGTPSNILEVSSFSNRAALDVIGVAGMSRDFNSLADPTNELFQVYKNIFSPNRTAQILGLIGLVVPMWIVRRLPVKRNNDMLQASRTIRQFCMDMITARKAELAGSSEKADDKLSKDKDIITVAIASGAFTDENLVDQLMTFLAAGHETTATSMQWALLSLCRYPAIQTRLRSALRDANLCPLAAPPSLTANMPITSDIIDNIPYLHAFCLEVLRLHSPVTMTLRITARTTTIVGHVIPKGTTVILGISALNQNKALWGPNAEVFDPERWINTSTHVEEGTGRETKVEKVNASGGASSNFAFLTFLHGPRSCIGQSFAKAEFACLMAAWVAAFDTQFADAAEAEKLGVGKKIEIQSGITARPKGGVRVKVTPVLE